MWLLVLSQNFQSSKIPLVLLALLVLLVAGHLGEGLLELLVDRLELLLLGDQLVLQSVHLHREGGKVAMITIQMMTMLFMNASFSPPIYNICFVQHVICKF